MIVRVTMSEELKPSIMAEEASPRPIPVTAMFFLDCSLDVCAMFWECCSRHKVEPRYLLELVNCPALISGNSFSVLLTT